MDSGMAAAMALHPTPSARIDYSLLSNVKIGLVPASHFSFRCMQSRYPIQQWCCMFIARDSRRRTCVCSSSFQEFQGDQHIQQDNTSDMKAGPHMSADIPTKRSRKEEFRDALKRYGVAGVLAYGLFNTVYYLVTFLTIWLYVLPSPGKLGYSVAARRCMKVLAIVWAGSQITKVFRAAGALAIAPVVDRGLSWLTSNFFSSRRKAFVFVVGACVGMAIVLFSSIVLLWA